MAYTYYWQVNQDTSIKDLLNKISDYVLNNGSELMDFSK